MAIYVLDAAMTAAICRWLFHDQIRPRCGGLNIRTSGVYLRADSSDIDTLDAGDDEARAALITRRVREWKSAAHAL